MTISTQDSKVNYQGNGQTTVFQIPFPFLENNQIYVQKKDAQGNLINYTYATDYTVTGAGEENGGSVTLNVAPEQGSTISIYRDVPLTQEVDYRENEIFPAETHEEALDKLTMEVQQIQEQLDRSVKVDRFSDVDLDNVINEIERVYDSTDNIDIVANNINDVNAVGDNIANVNTVAGDIDSVVTTATNINDVKTVAQNKASLNITAANINDIKTVSSIKDDVPTVANNSANVTTVATNISDVNTAASNIEAIKDAPNQASSAQNSATQASQSAASAITSAQQAASSAAGTHFKLFHHQWFDYELNDMAWLRADTFSWQDGTVYANAYNHLVDDIDGITPATETVGGQTVTFYRASDGHKIVLADQEATVNNIYTAAGVAWYYILDTANNRFKLPRTKYDFNGLRGNVGDYIPESLPNITGSFNINTVYNPTGDGALYSKATTLSNNSTSQGSETNNQLGFDASRSSSTYQNNAPVQQRGTQQYLYFYVGQYTQSAIEQTAGLNAELFNNKIDIDGDNVITAGANKILNTSSYTTNRILEIPQDIKLELNNGTLTLKAGSKVYVPNGFESDGTTPKFDVVTIDIDKTVTDANQRTLIIGVDIDGNTEFALEGETGSPAASTYKYYYDNNANKCYVSTIDTYYQTTFPLCIATSGSSGFTSIDQVFNGFGYIGSHFFVLPGVKVQIPNGRNEDGSYKTFSVKTNSVTTASFPNTVTGGMNWYIDNFGNAAYYGSNYIKFSENNLWESTDGKDYILKGVVVATSAVTSGVISDWKPCTVDSVANSNALNFSQAGKQTIVGWGLPDYSASLALPTDGTVSTIPSNGWIEVALGAYNSNQGNWSLNGVLRNISRSNNSGYSTYTTIIYPVNKGDTVSILSGEPGTRYLTFYPCRGV